MYGKPNYTYRLIWIWGLMWLNRNSFSCRFLAWFPFVPTLPPRGPIYLGSVNTPRPSLLAFAQFSVGPKTQSWASLIVIGPSWILLLSPGAGNAVIDPVQVKCPAICSQKQSPLHQNPSTANGGGFPQGSSQCRVKSQGCQLYIVGEWANSYCKVSNHHIIESLLRRGITTT